jgi:hypothetical protein
VRIVVYLVLIVIALGVNYWAAHKATAVQRVRIAYSPFFLAQVQAGNVAQITSRGTAIQGVFRHSTRSPAGGSPATRFATEIPAFADTAELSRLHTTALEIAYTRAFFDALPAPRDTINSDAPTATTSRSASRASTTRDSSTANSPSSRGISRSQHRPASFFASITASGCSASAPWLSQLSGMTMTVARICPCVWAARHGYCDMPKIPPRLVE